VGFSGIDPEEKKPLSRSERVTDEITPGGIIPAPFQNPLTPSRTFHVANDPALFFPGSFIGEGYIHFFKFTTTDDPSKIRRSFSTFCNQDQA